MSNRYGDGIYSDGLYSAANTWDVSANAASFAFSGAAKFMVYYAVTAPVSALGLSAAAEAVVIKDITTAVVPMNIVPLASAYVEANAKFVSTVPLSIGMEADARSIIDVSTIGTTAFGSSAEVVVVKDVSIATVQVNVLSAATPDKWHYHNITAAANLDTGGVAHLSKIFDIAAPLVALNIVANSTNPFVGLFWQPVAEDGSWSPAQISKHKGAVNG